MRAILLFAAFSSFFAGAQKMTINGYVKDSETRESLIGAAIFHRKTLSGTTANVHGFYSLTLAGDSVELVYSYVGYQPLPLKFLLTKDTTINVYLTNANQLEEVVINATRADEIHEINRMSSVSIPIDDIKALPALFGEVDVLKVIQLMPGVKSSEGSTGLYVRGGGPDQNLMLLDGVPVYNASHLFGFFSVFNADAINRVELIKGGFPARYGGRLSSVIDINMKDGDMKKVHGEGSVGIVAAKATVEGPIIKDKTSFLLSARRTYIDAIARPIIRDQGGGTTGYYFYDLNAKVNHIINQKNRIYLSTYFGDDKAYARLDDFDVSDGIRTDTHEEFGLKWGNVITAFRWNRVITPKLFANLTTTYSRYRFTVFSEYEEKTTPQIEGGDLAYGSEYRSGIRDWAAKADFDFMPNPNHYIKFGAGVIRHLFSPGVFAFRSDVESDTTLGTSPIPASEFDAYIEDDIRIGNRWRLNLGGHSSLFFVENRSYHSLQPRAASRYLLGREWSVKASYATMTQFIHLLTNAGLGLPTDLWVPSTARIKPQNAHQAAIGVAKTYRSKYEFSLEAYYKRMNNLIEYKDGASFIHVEGDWQDKVVSNGRGDSYGTELLLQKKTGTVTGWVGYTLSWANRQFDELNSGNWFPYKYDRRHDISLALSHAWNDRMDFAMAWVYGTGNALTLPIARYSGARIDAFSGRYNYFGSFNEGILYHSGRNDYRMRSYHRLDLSFSFRKKKKWGQREWTFGVYNAYNRRNPFFVTLGYDEDTRKNKFIQYSLFPFIPSVSYSFKF